MKKFFLILLLSSVIVTVFLLWSNNTKLTPQSGEQTLLHNGITRTYVVHLPKDNEKKQNLPLVIVLHGGGGDIESIQTITSFNQAADNNVFVAAYPQGTGVTYLGKTFGTWNAGTCCPPATTNDSDDVGFIKDLISELHKKYAIDLRRVYVTGLSNGAQLSYRLACELSDHITAIAPVSGIAPFDGLKKCQPQKPVPIFHIHGTNDPCVFVAGGNCGGCFASLTSALGLESQPHIWLCSDLDSYLKAWATIYDLDINQTKTYHTDSLDCLTYTDATNNHPITKCLVSNNGHTWAGGNYGPACKQPDSKICTVTKEVLGPLNSTVNTTQLIWDFFSQYQK
ncbi:MAG: hypothetical protein HUU49_04945 [Candidatus Buchananbacteria bacterium]|nr:hypothetical protein [Candidatus Buchananbacteria bacterium]